jgi:pimeloyl-ACP methyl ester carboxylesterase
MTHDGKTLSYREAGVGKPGTPMVLVHGAGANAGVWMPVMGRLARHRRVVAIDLPDHGRSGGRADSIEEMRDAVGLLCAVLCLPKAILVGHSMGGLVVLDAGLAWPDKVEAVVSVMSGARLKVSQGVFDALGVAAWPKWTDMFAEVSYSPETPRDVRRRGAALATATSRERAEADFKAVAQYDARARAPALLPPLLVVTGAHDLMTPPKWGEALAASVPGARHEVLERCGHMPMHEQPDRLVDAIDRFTAGIPARTVQAVPGTNT